MELLSRLLRASWMLRPALAERETPPALAQPEQDFSQHARRLTIACPSPTAEDLARDTHRLRGQFLARQDQWDKLSAEIAAADESRAVTPAGMPLSELLCYGARSDVVAAVEHALADGAPESNEALLDGIEALEQMLSEAPRDAILAVTVAQAHMDIGWAWRGAGWLDEVPAPNLDAFEAHFDRAREILSSFADDDTRSAILQAARCGLNGQGVVAGTDLTRDFERLIDLNPKAPAPMRALGNYLTPKWYGSYEKLELEARRTAARLNDHWGAGAYTWVMFDALSGDLGVCEVLDVEFFVEGLNDILQRMPDQHTVNLLAAFCAQTIGARKNDVVRTIPQRAEIASCADWIVRHHLTELHPLVWAHATAAFDNSLTVKTPRRFAALGRQGGLRAIAALFKNDIAAGRRIIFTADGPVAEHC